MAQRADLYKKVLKFWRPVIGRFLGYKATAGVDMYPNPGMGFHNLFVSNWNNYCSNVVNGPVFVSGILIPDNYEDSPLANEIWMKYGHYRT